MIQDVLDRVRFDDQGLLPAIIQEESSKDVLTVGQVKDALRADGVLVR